MALELYVCAHCHWPLASGLNHSAPKKVHDRNVGSPWFCSEPPVIFIRFDTILRLTTTIHHLHSRMQPYLQQALRDLNHKRYLLRFTALSLMVSTCATIRSLHGNSVVTSYTMFTITWNIAFYIYLSRHSNISP